MGTGRRQKYRSTWTVLSAEVRILGKSKGSRSDTSGKGGGQWQVVGDQPRRERAECRKESWTNLVAIVEDDVEGVEREAGHST